MAKIIIVEDDLKVANIYKQRLCEDGYSVEIVNDDGAFSKIQSEKPNVEDTNEVVEAIQLGASGYSVKSETNLDTLSQKVKEVLESSGIGYGIKS